MGAGAGIAAAFNAPLAGTVFVVEEAASFFSKRLLLHSFITCACAVVTANLLEGAMGLPPESVYSRTAGCLGDVTWSRMLILHVTVVGVLCGLLAIFFNRVVVVLSAAFAAQASRLGRGRKLFLRRFAFSALVGGLCGAFAMSLPQCIACRDASLQNAFSGSNGCILEDWLQQLVVGSRSVNASLLPEEDRGDGPRATAYEPHPGLFGAQYDPVLCPWALTISESCRLEGIEAFLPNNSYLRPSHFCCGFSSLAALRRGEFFDHSRPSAPLDMGKELWPQAQCPAASWDADNKVWIEHYSPGAALTLVAPTAVVRNLLTRGAPGVLPWQAVALFLVGFFVLAACSATAWVPGGLLVPMMAVGAAAGRLYGIAWAHPSGGASTDPHYAIPWIPELRPLLDLLQSGTKNEVRIHSEPGILALAGCAAFLSGSGSLVMFVLVLLLEVTLEPFLIPVILISVLAARTVTSLLGAHGLYHELMNVQSLPFLPETGHWRQGHFVVEDLLREDREASMRRTSVAAGGLEPVTSGAVGEDSGLPSVISISRLAGRADIQQVLRAVLPGDSKPMVHGFPVVDTEGQLCGLVTREALEGLLGSQDARDSEDSSTPMPSMALPLAAPSDAAQVPATGVEDVMDTAPFVLQKSTPVHHAHMLFARCGLRHVVVVDGAHRPIGVLTRKSLMPWRMPWLDEEALHHDTFLEQREAHSPTASPGVSPRNSPHSSPRVSRRGSRRPSQLQASVSSETDILSPEVRMTSMQALSPQAQREVSAFIEP
eukprot:TRINITY_DN15326_c0_g3_i1.p1 TRINITY_DN15326_c0_g3~~TRINITY_DN15326_c0_g3_i1.p1  ORF type:complete len:806 (+),score=131.73 TRINITY_DN15326_c0_g3_i1:109-2418(+)